MFRRIFASLIVVSAVLAMTSYRLSSTHSKITVGI